MLLFRYCGKKKSENRTKLIALAIVIVLVLVGAIAYGLNRSDSENVCTTYDGKVTEQCTNDYIGLSKEDAELKAENNQLESVVLKVDGNHQPLLAVAYDKPIYFIVEKGEVSQAYFKFNLPQTY